MVCNKFYTKTKSQIRPTLHHSGKHSFMLWKWELQQHFFLWASLILMYFCIHKFNLGCSVHMPILVATCPHWMLMFWFHHCHSSSWHFGSCCCFCPQSWQFIFSMLMWSCDVISLPLFLPLVAFVLLTTGGFSLFFFMQLIDDIIFTSAAAVTVLWLLLHFYHCLLLLLLVTDQRLLLLLSLLAFLLPVDCCCFCHLLCCLLLPHSCLPLKS